MKFILVLSSFVMVFLLHPAGAVAKVNFELGLSESLRVDQLDWNIGGRTNPGNYVNILSELVWEDLQIWQLDLHAEVTERSTDWPFLTSVLRADIASGLIYAGSNRDSDYAGNDRTLEFSRSENSADNGETLDASVAAGVLFALGKSNFSLGPFCGYSRHEQELHMTDGWQTVSNQLYADLAFGPQVIEVPDTGPFAGLDSRYATEWRGPWGGVEASWQVSRRWQLRVANEYHSVNYKAVADWNLRSDFAHPQSFEHTGDGYGVVTRVEINVQFWQRLSLSAGVTHGSWKVANGRDRTFFADGSIADTQLNEVNWDSTTFRLGLAGRF